MDEGRLSGFHRSWERLDKSQAALTRHLVAAAADARARARAHERQAVFRAWGVAIMTLAVMLTVALVLFRLGAANGRLVARLRRAGSQLTSSHVQLEAGQALAHIGSWEWHPGTGETVRSPEMHRILGIEPTPGRSPAAAFESRVHPDDLARVRADRARVLRQDYDSVSNYRIVLPDGRLRDVQGRVMVVRDEAGHVSHLVGTLQDSTEQRAVERMKDEFIGVVSHELRTPLTSIRGSLGLLASGEVELSADQGRRLLEVALHSSERLARLVNDILDLEQMTEGGAHLDLVTCPARDLASGAVDEMRGMADASGVHLELVQAEGIVHVDQDMITQALTNLLSNAIKFSPAGGTVSVTAATVEDAVVFEVSDRGRGIPPGQEDAIFDRFHQVDACHSRDREGTGLGLAICRAILTQHGGRIWARNNEGPGCTFAFSVAHAPTPSDAAAARADAAPADVYA